MKALVTGSGGLIGSECVRLLSELGWDVLGIENDMRRAFLGVAASTSSTSSYLRRTCPRFHQVTLDICDRQSVRDLFQAERPQFIIHTAAQPSSVKSALIPYEDFDVNATGTLNLLVASRDFTRDAPFCFTSTNKVYGDHLNSLPLEVQNTRYDFSDGRDGIDESLPIDQCLHSLYGASKLAADLMCQEFGRYYQMPVGIFRCAAVTGPQHAAVELHGFLAYLTQCAVFGREYTVFGHQGKQVRDQLHCRDAARLFLHFFANPALARSIIWVAAGRTACRSWKRSTSSMLVDTKSAGVTSIPTGSAITCATSPISARSVRTFPAGSRTIP